VLPARVGQPRPVARVRAGVLPAAGRAPYATGLGLASREVRDSVGARLFTLL